MNNNVQNVNDGPGATEWFRSLPVITQYWFGGTIICTLAGNFGVISPSQFVWAWGAIKSRFELWRALTCFCYAGPFAFETLITIFMLYTMSLRYEQGSPFNTGAGGGTADYAFALLFAMTVMLITFPLVVGFFPIPPVFSKNLVYFVMYVWSKRNPTAQANIWGIPMQAIYLPFAYLGLTVFMGNPYFNLLHGLAVGHLYYFLVDVFPQVYGKDLLVTPNFLIDKFGVGQYRPDRELRGAADARPAPGATGAGGGGHAWGGEGRPLGRQ
jgi:Derlin-2/3